MKFLNSVLTISLCFATSAHAVIKVDVAKNSIYPSANRDKSWGDINAYLAEKGDVDAVSTQVDNLKNVVNGGFTTRDDAWTEWKRLHEEWKKKNDSAIVGVMKAVNSIPAVTVTNDMVASVKARVLEELKEEWVQLLTDEVIKEFKAQAIEELRAEWKGEFAKMHGGRELLNKPPFLDEAPPLRTQPKFKDPKK